MSILQNTGIITSSSDRMRNNSDKIKELLEPFLTDDLLLHTLKEWSRPLPSRDLFRPLVLVGPSGVGKGRIIKNIIKDYGRWF